MTDKTNPVAERRICGIPSMSLGPCDLAWGHDGVMHASCGDGFRALGYDAEHERRQRELADAHPPSPPEPAAEGAEGAVAWCPLCGKEPRSDEDGCCAQCGATIGCAPDVAVLESVIRGWQARAQAAEARTEDYRRRLDSEKEHVSYLTAELATSQKEVEAMHAVCRSKQSSINKLEPEVSALRAELEQAKESLERHRKFACDVQEHIDNNVIPPRRLALIREALSVLRSAAAPAQPETAAFPPPPPVDPRLASALANPPGPRHARLVEECWRESAGTTLTLADFDRLFDARLATVVRRAHELGRGQLSALEIQDSLRLLAEAAEESSK